MTPTEPLTQEATMTICQLLFWIVLGGSIGGITAMLIRVKAVKDGTLLDEISVRPRSLFGQAISSLFIGSAAALAIQWILIAIGSFRSTIRVEDTMFIVAISVVAGYSAREILPMIAKRLGEEITRRELQETKKEVIERVKDVKEDLSGSMTETDLSTSALVYLSSGSLPFERHKIRNEMESYLESHPTARGIAIILARMCAEADNDLGSALAVLDRFLKAKTERRESGDKDYADALYNRACYKLKLWESHKREEYKNQAYEDLKRSIEISPENKVDAQNDKDLQLLRDEERFKALGAVEEQKKTTLPL